MPSFILPLWLSLTASVLAGMSHFKLELSWGKGAPDGYERDMIFINGQYPGPLLDIQQGDWVEIEVLNSMPFNTTIHAHGNVCRPW
jgi:FtsP/CotA-like multicopper oxidase with cupredoxin domain